MARKNVLSQVASLSEEALGKSAGAKTKAAGTKKTSSAKKT